MEIEETEIAEVPSILPSHQLSELLTTITAGIV